MTEGNGREYQFDYTKEVIDCIEMYQDLIAKHEAIIQDMKRAIQSNAMSGLRIASQRDVQAADEVATYLYWFYDKYIPSAVICDFYGTYPQNIQKYVGTATFTVTCIDCKQPYDEVLRSRSHLKELKHSKRGVCPECQAKRDSSNKQYRSDYEARKEAEQQIINQLRAMPYDEYLKTNHWLTVRTKMLKHANYRCQVCNGKNVSLHVHHRTYENRGCEVYGDLTVLCATCHKTFHENGRLES